MGRLSELMSLIKKNVDTLNGLNNVTDNYIILNATLHLLQVSIQAMIDLSSRLIVELGYKIPSTYSEIPSILKELNIINHDDALIMKKMIGFRNVVVHGYTDISTDLVKRIMIDRKYQDILLITLKIFNYAVNKNIDP